VTNEHDGTSGTTFLDAFERSAAEVTRHDPGRIAQGDELAVSELEAARAALDEFVVGQVRVFFDAQVHGFHAGMPVLADGSWSDEVQESCVEDCQADFSDAGGVALVVF